MRPGDGTEAPQRRLSGPPGGTVRGCGARCVLGAAQTSAIGTGGPRSLGAHPRENEWGRVFRGGQGCARSRRRREKGQRVVGPATAHDRGYAKGRGREHSPRCRAPLHPALPRDPRAPDGRWLGERCRGAQRRAAAGQRGHPQTESSPGLTPADRQAGAASDSATHRGLFFFFFFFIRKTVTARLSGI